MAIGVYLINIGFHLFSSKYQFGKMPELSLVSRKIHCLYSWISNW